MFYFVDRQQYDVGRITFLLWIRFVNRSGPDFFRFCFPRILSMEKRRRKNQRRICGLGNDRQKPKPKQKEKQASKQK